MLKNESARNVMKPVPLCLSRLPDSSGIFTLSNGLVWRRYRILSEKSNRQKKKIADCAVRTVRTDADVACPYADMVGPYR
jgi:hypothetical protein